ncbi:hypothetical protein CHARACLAT_021564 [Characodon lateralis]|uniref:Uncharacterized protein n=1 Tax=Characodon lateralis TaxID=208331 RepID=A0ABU7D315_9TELE|nr:hypothetical protein [Characodon lateralis]
MNQCFCVTLPWQMATHTDPGCGSGGLFFLLKRSFPFGCHYMHAYYEGLLQSKQHNASHCSLFLHARPEVNSASQILDAGELQAVQATRDSILDVLQEDPSEALHAGRSAYRL